jgi:hypothetical protein
MQLHDLKNAKKDHRIEEYPDEIANLLIMTTIILPTDILSTEPRKRGSYGSLLTHIVRASLDAEEAVHIFASLLLGTHQSGFSKFDAHVGDTACHIRASLVRELYMSCKKEDAEGYASLLSAMAVHFRRIRKAAETTCFQLTQHRANPVVVGFSAKQDTLDNIINALCSLKLDGIYNRCPSILH